MEHARKEILGRLPPVTSDPLLALIGAFRGDQRREKLDLGVGVYRDAVGATPVMRAVKAAEAKLLETQATKAYLGAEGDQEFIAALEPIVFARSGGPHRFGLQTPGGTGALRLAADLVRAAHPEASVWLGSPSWPVHHSIMAATGLRVATYQHPSDAASFAAMLDTLGMAAPGDVVLLHGCCHNPTGQNFTVAQWKSIVEIIGRQQLVPLVDLAYQGLGDGLDRDAEGLRLVVDGLPEVLVAYSCDKNFGLYRDRTGALWLQTATARALTRARDNALAIARALWSMPPDHGAAIARIVLTSSVLNADWLAELALMRERLTALRKRLAASHNLLRSVAEGRGLFAMLPISPTEVARLREDFAVYLPASGRINIAGLSDATMSTFLNALDLISEARP